MTGLSATTSCFSTMSVKWTQLVPFLSFICWAGCGVHLELSWLKIFISRGTNNQIIQEITDWLNPSSTLPTNKHTNIDKNIITHLSSRGWTVSECQHAAFHLTRQGQHSILSVRTPTQHTHTHTTPSAFFLLNVIIPPPLQQPAHSPNPSLSL